MVPAAHIDNHDLDLYVRVQLDAARTSDIQSHVLSCPACEDKLVAGLLARLSELNQKEPGDNHQEQRFEQRLRSGEQGSLQTLCPLSFDQSAIQIADVSKGGFGVLAVTPLAIGTMAQIRIGTTIALGEVRHCRAAANNQFHLGIHVRSVRELSSIPNRPPVRRGKYPGLASTR